MIDFKFAEHLAVFVDVVRSGSFSGAARKRSAAPSSIQRQVDGLEHNLGTPLFTRSTRALALTDAGQRLFERAQRILDDLTDARAEVTSLGGAVAGTLRLACYPTFGRRYVIPLVQTLMEAHPDLRVELDLTERLADPVVDRLDAVIRIGVLVDSNLVSAKLATQKRILVASSAYLARAGRPASVAEIASRHRRLDKLHGADLLGWRDILDVPMEDQSASGIVFRCDDFEALREACLDGAGIAFLPSWVVGLDVKNGLLERLLPKNGPPAESEVGIHLVRALPDTSSKLKAFSTALRKAIGSPPIWDRFMAGD
jgi:DNA-binding transcriptional LysR family regulator